MVAFTTCPRTSVGNRRDGAFHNGRMGEAGAFHLERADAVAGGFYHIVLTPHKPVISVLVRPGHIACVVHPVVPCGVCQLLIVKILLE